MRKSPHIKVEVSEIISKLSTFSASKRLLDGIDHSFSWDKKKYVEDYFDLKDFSIFFKIKSLNQFSLIFPKEYSDYREAEYKIKSWINTFEKVPEEFLDEIEIFPSKLALEFLFAKNELFSSWIEKINKTEAFNKFTAFYRENKSSFFLLRQMKYDTNTKDGFKQVNLEFSENFRFKSRKGCLNIFNMPSKNRDFIIPNNSDEFIYMADFRQFEFRTFLSIVGADVDYSNNDLYRHIGERLGLEDPKIELISYLYSDRIDANIKTLIDKDKFVENLSGDFFEWNGYPVFLGENSLSNKKIHSIIQTISYMIYLKKFYNILELLKEKRSKLIFPLHDAMIFSISKNEIELIEKISDILSDEIYTIKQYCGNDLLNIKELE